MHKLIVASNSLLERAFGPSRLFLYVRDKRFSLFGIGDNDGNPVLGIKARGVNVNPPEVTDSKVSRTFTTGLRAPVAALAINVTGKKTPVIERNLWRKRPVPRNKPMKNRSSSSSTASAAPSLSLVTKPDAI